jgi:hypothetical protein
MLEHLLIVLCVSLVMSLIYAHNLIQRKDALIYELDNRCDRYLEMIEGFKTTLFISNEESKILRGDINILRGGNNAETLHTTEQSSETTPSP